MVNFPENFIIINRNKIELLVALGILKLEKDSCQDSNIGESNYSEHVIQPWNIWQDWNLDPWDADIVKRVLRTKVQQGKTDKDSRIEDYQKIKHICDEKIRQLQFSFE